MVFGETVAVYCENHTEPTDTLCGAECRDVMGLTRRMNIRCCLVLVERDVTETGGELLQADPTEHV
jgi:hypothetical protein